jgi:hypothetical protein
MDQDTPNIQARPPFCVMPEKEWIELRVWELIRCLSRYNDASAGDYLARRTAGAPVRDWMDELRRRLNEVLYNNQV